MGERQGNDWAVRLQQWAEMESGRFVLWAPVFLVAGIAAYFRLNVEPPWGTTAIGLTLIGISWAYIARRRWGTASWFARALFFIVLGFALIQVRTAVVAAPIIHQETDVLPVEGYLLEIEQRPGSQRWLVRTTRIGGMPTENLPERVRVTRRGEPGDVVPGDLVSFRAILSPPPVPVMPGGFDYGRQLFYEEIGAVGFSVTPARTQFRPQRPALFDWITHLRARIADRIIDKAGPETGPVLAALVTGRRERISEPVVDQLRDTGLAHLLAISGLHMGLVCGFLFFGTRFLLVRIETVAARFPVKKWSAIIALMGGTIYLALSGAAWSAQRAYIMAAIGFIAILFDKRAISLRNVAFAAILILVWRPEAAVSAGFQMSFAAVTALIATYAWWEARRREREHRPVMKPVRFVGGLSTTSLVAGLATTPFAIYHFHRIANFGLPTNIIVMPIVTTAVVPVAILGLMAMPFGVDGPFWWFAGKAIDVVLQITAWVAARPHSVAIIAQWPTAAWLLAVWAILGTSLLVAPWRWACLLAVPLALLVAEFSDRPQIFIAEDAGNVGVLMDAEDGGVLILANRRRDRFAVNQWLVGEGLDREEHPPILISDCAEDICKIQVSANMWVATAETPEATARACREAAIVVARVWKEGALRESCRAHLFTAESVARTGPASVVVGKQGIQVRYVNDTRKDRPWSNRSY